jgi:citrate lyase beta subunit
MTAPVHVLYGGAHLFSAGTPKKLGELARRALDKEGDALGELLGIGDDVIERVRRKLRSEPIEDLRIDFEDGFGVRSDDEEDEQATRTGGELANTERPRIIGIRVKSNRERALRTVDRFVAAGGFPDVITIPKVTMPEDVSFLVDRLPDHCGIEIMVEDVRALMSLRAIADAARGRCVAAHLGTYDLTASAGIAAPHQTPDHPTADFARQMMLVAFAGTDVRLSDGATTVLPIGDRSAVHLAWQQHYRDVRRHLSLGFYQGWDLHPAQLVSRYAAVFAFYREALPTMTLRMRSFLDASERSSRVGNVFDDAATGRGLSLFFDRGVACGALDRDEVVT